jgi:hypothetical protein
MPQTVIQAAHNLVKRAGNRGRIIPPADFDKLAEELAIPVPPWLRELFTSVPLCGLEFAWQKYEPDSDFDGLEVMEWADAPGIRSETLQCYPGIVLREFGYISVASDSMGGGDPYFVNVHEGIDPPLYQIYHDISDQASRIIAGGRRIVSPRLSDFFLSARLDA